MSKKNFRQYHIRLNQKDVRRLDFLKEKHEADSVGQLVRLLLRNETKDVPLFDEPTPTPPLADKR